MDGVLKVKVWQFQDLVDWLAKAYPLGLPRDQEQQARYIYQMWLSGDHQIMDQFFKEKGIESYSHLELRRMFKPTPKQVSSNRVVSSGLSPREYRGGISGNVKEAMSRKAVKLYTSAQLQIITKAIREMQSHLRLKTSEEIEPRIHAFPKREGQKSYPLELTLLTDQQFRRYMIDEQGNLVWEQRYDCEQTYDTYGSLVEGDNFEHGEE